MKMNTALIVALMCMWYAVPAAAKGTLLAMPRNSTEHCYAEINVHGPYGVYFRVVPHPPGGKSWVECNSDYYYSDKPPGVQILGTRAGCRVYGICGTTSTLHVAGRGVVCIKNICSPRGMIIHRIRKRPVVAVSDEM